MPFPSRSPPYEAKVMNWPEDYERIKTLQPRKFYAFQTAGAALSDLWVVPRQTLWTDLFVMIEVATSAIVANRYLTLFVLSPDRPIAGYAGGFNMQYPAMLASQYHYGFFAESYPTYQTQVGGALADLNVWAPLPKWPWSEGWSFQVQLDNGQVGDEVHGMFYYTETNLMNR